LALYNVMSIRKPLPNPSAKRLAGSPSLRAARPNRLLRAP
jgi:hypothetical protein